MQNLKLKMGNLEAKLEFGASVIFSVGHLQLSIIFLLEIVSVFWKIATSCPASFLTDDADTAGTHVANVLLCWRMLPSVLFWAWFVAAVLFVTCIARAYIYLLMICSIVVFVILFSLFCC